MADEKWNLRVLSSGERSVLKRSAGTMMGKDFRAMDPMKTSPQVSPLILREMN